jgi:protein-tyrosine phosphatase
MWKKTISTVLLVVIALFTSVCNSGPQERAASDTGSSTENTIVNAHLIKLDGNENMRDLGGYVATDGTVIKKHVFIRSDRLSRLSEEDKHLLFRNIGVDCVIDLRSDREVAAEPDPIPEDCQYYRIVLDNPTMGAGNMPTMLDNYIAALNSKDAIKEIFKILADAQYDTIIYHCTAGKDRTGVISMLLLSIAGVDRETIISDFAISDKLLIALTNEMLEANPNMPIEYTLSKAETMESAIEHLNATYGGIIEYLDEIGVDEAIRNSIKAKMFG